MRATKDGSREHLARAIRLAEENVSSGLGGPFGCVIVKDGQVIAEGTNLVTSLGDPTAHAEIVAIRKACQKLGSFQLTDCDVYASCEPCPMCLGAIYWARPARLFFAAGHDDASDAGFDDSRIREELVHRHDEWRLPTVRMMEDEGKKPFEAWKKSTDKKEY